MRSLVARLMAMVSICTWGAAANPAVASPAPLRGGQPCPQVGDVNRDGYWSAGDAQMAFAISLGLIVATPEEACAADCDGDGVVSMTDVERIFLTALGQRRCVPGSDNHPPEVPELVGPAPDESIAAPDADLRVFVFDPDSDPLNVQVFGRILPGPAADFSIVALPDTQYYTCGCNGGTPQILWQQLAWTVQAQQALGVAFVTHVGDMTEHGDQIESEWTAFNAALSLLEDPLTTGRPEGIPFGLALGNHDQYWGSSGIYTQLYNAYFGQPRFAGRGYYGGSRDPANNNDHFELFEAGGRGYLVMHLEYRDSFPEDVLAWAEQVLAAHGDRPAIVVSHFLLFADGNFSWGGQQLYDRLKVQPNLALMLAGHVLGEGRRTDVFEDRAVHTLLSDYQGRSHGGDGWLRIVQFRPGQGEIEVSTYSPTLDQFEVDDDSHFVLPAESLRPPWQPLGSVEAASDEVVGVTWTDLPANTQFEWYVVVSDGADSITSPVWHFASL